METLVVALAALIAAVLIDAGYWIAVSMMRWAPILIVGASIGWFANREGLSSTEALATGVLASIAVRHLLRCTAEARDWSD